MPVTSPLLSLCVLFFSALKGESRRRKRTAGEESGTHKLSQALAGMNGRRLNTVILLYQHIGKLKHF